MPIPTPRKVTSGPPPVVDKATAEARAAEARAAAKVARAAVVPHAPFALMVDGQEVGQAETEEKAKALAPKVGSHAVVGTVTGGRVVVWAMRYPKAPEGA